MKEFDNKILIINDKAKNSLLSRINELVNIKIITLSELKKKYYFDYDEKAIYYVCNKYNVVYDIAVMYLNNLYYIKDIDDEKVKFLISLKEDLAINNLLIETPLFREFLKGKDIVLYNLSNTDKFYYNMFDEIKKYSNVSEYNDSFEVSKKDLYKANNIEDEVSFVASSICKLIKSGVDINKIKLANVNSSYYYTIKNTFKLFNIPIILPNNSSIKGTRIVKEFKKNFSNNIEGVLDSIKKFIKTSEDENIYKQIINILNKYYWTDDYESAKNYIFHDIDKICKGKKELLNAVRIIDIENDLISDDYVFLINYNEGIIPHSYKDEDYLSDEIKLKLNISTSYELNKKSNENIVNKIKMYKHLVVTYHEFEDKDRIYISGSYNEDLFNEKEIMNSYEESNAYNKIKLVSLKDDNQKYGTISDDLILLNTNYSNEKYLSYDNKFKGIDPIRSYKYIDNKLVLSYTSMNEYYECSFKYYLNRVLRVNKYEDTFNIIIGNIFHNILSECLTCDNYDFESAWAREVERPLREYTRGEYFFLDILKEDLLLIIDIIKNQMNYTQLKNIVCEKSINVVINDNLNISFYGKVDKIMYDEFDGEMLCAIIDYKTGTPSLDLKNVVHGLGMQLPIYIYLVKNSSEFKNVRIGGFYLQHILNNKNTREEKEAELKLQGYTNSNIKYIDKVDTSYESSNIIKSLAVKQDGDFTSRSKLINDDEIDILNKIISKKVEEAAMSIVDAKFDINPKTQKEKNLSCNLCKFKDICYKKNEDFVELPVVDNIFGGEEDGIY